MKKIHLIMGAILLLFIAAAIAGILATRPPGPDAEPSAKPVVKGSSPAKERLVDTRLLLTARRLAVLATALDEQEFSRQALRLADHELDLALADSIRRTVENHAAPSPEIKAILALSDKGQDAVKGDQQRIKMIETQLAGAREQDQEILEDQLEVAKAQLELDKNELDEAQDDLDRAGGDVQAKIRRLKAAHEAAQGNSSLVSTLNPISQFSPDSLVARISMWSWQLSKLAQLRQAHQEAQTKIERMSKRRDSLAQKLKLEKEDRETVKRKAASFARGDMKGVGESSKEISKATLQTLKRFMSDQRTLADMGKRLQFVKDLAEVYGGWTVVVESHRRAALHQMLRSLMVILSILGVMFFGKLLVGHMFAGAAKTRGIRAGTLRTVAIFVLQILGVLVILFVVFGVPTQMTTILGLAGAGLTVALKDFIVAFFGWFVLMGNNGIRVGDWVEIDGVAGEVVEIGLLRTVLLETGSLSDSAHPTGRRVAFVNSFAIEGHFFNFSTSGQWMWDELKVAVPSGQDLYPFIDAIRKQVEEMTEANAKLAEQEWRGSTKRYRIQSFSAVPRISVVPISSGIELHVGYITRAYESHETRTRLNQSLVDLMHGKRPDEV